MASPFTLQLPGIGVLVHGIESPQVQLGVVPREAIEAAIAEASTYREE